MSEIDAKTRELLKQFGFSDEMIKEKQSKLERTADKKAKKRFVPKMKKMIKITHCLFCRKTIAGYYLMHEISFATWEGHEVSKEQFMETEGIKTKPSTYNVNYCYDCPEYIDKLTEERIKEILINIITPDMGRINY